MIKENYQISFSGGLTSAYMTKRMIDELSNDYNFIVTFANTGREDEKTLEFINKCDTIFGFNTVWLEADVQFNERVGTGFKIVDYKTASRKSEPFENVIKKYGIPNVAYPHCTRELKLSPMRAYLKSLGIKHTEIKTAIGIRTDEKRRVSKVAEKLNITYPLIELFNADKQTVLDFWEDQSFSLGLSEHNGNCNMCFKKSFKKLGLQLKEDPTSLDWCISMEDTYGLTNNAVQKPAMVFFRGNTSSVNLKDILLSSSQDLSKSNQYENSGCTESCEIYDMQVLDE